VTGERSNRSAGLLVWRATPRGLEVLLGHPGGPFFASKDEGVWSVLKGEIMPGEEPVDVARREFEEETGWPPPSGPTIDLGEIRQRGGKTVVAWAVQSTDDLDPTTAVSNTFEMEWPPRSSTTRSFPEIDRVAWFDPPAGRAKINPAQVPLLDRLEEALAGGERRPTGSV
jgi:predicted NUDIX family NTP pyrophosphohydrolase